METDLSFVFPSFSILILNLLKIRLVNLNNKYCPKMIKMK